VPPRETTAYASDYFAWVQEQVAALRAGRIDHLDLKNLAEEVGDLGISVKREIASRLKVLLIHLLKWQFQPAGRSSSWKATIVDQRSELLDELAESPSLRRYPAEILERKYATARFKVAAETRLPETAFPQACPFAIADILDPNFFPEAGA
jgi:hypothetical protein